MKDKYFIDTNIFIYAFDAEPQKREKANSLIKTALLEHKGCISSQVIQEFINVSTKKFIVPLSIKDCEKYLKSVLLPLCEIYANYDLYHRALDIMERWHYSFYDSLIIAAALQTDCAVLYSEDLQHQQKIQSLTLINPFI
jgi:predicted nucleic acid-binding protein